MSNLETNNAADDAVMREYRAIICSLIEMESSRIVPNESPRHASVIIEEMVRHAKRSFLAVAQRLNPSVWGAGVVKSIEEAVNRGVDIGLLVVKEDTPHLSTWPAGVRARIRRVSRNDALDDVNTVNFATMDSRALRLELDKKSCRAAFCASNAELAGLATARFNALWGNAAAL